MRPVTLMWVALLILTACAAPLDTAAETFVPPEMGAPAPAASAAPEATVELPAAGVADASPTPALPAASPEAPPANPAAQAIVQQAKEMLAGKLGIEAGAIRLFNLKAMDWPDESLGCPLGGRNYAQVITPGYLIELETGSSIYIFHSDQGSRVLLCGLEPTREIYQPP